MEEKIIEEKIIKTENGEDIEGFHEYRLEYTNITRERNIFTIFPILHNNKIYWLKKIKIKEQKYHLYKNYLDEWDYKMVWEYKGEHWKRIEVIQ